MAIKIKTEEEIQRLRRAGHVLALTHQMIEKAIKPGISTYELDQLAYDFIKSHKVEPGFLGYNGFPGTICASINDEVVHGIPSKKRILKEGDIVSVDIGTIYEGYYSDAARTHPVGLVAEEAKRLIEVTKQSFYEGIKQVKAGNHLHQISAAIQKYVEDHGYSIVRDLVGHGVGKELHEEPQIPNFKTVGRGPKLAAGMVVAIEPMVNIGKYDVRWLDDNWTVVTLDGSMSSHHENTLLITEEGCELLSEL